MEHKCREIKLQVIFEREAVERSDQHANVAKTLPKLPYNFPDGRFSAGRGRAHECTHVHMQIMLQNTTATGKTAVRVCAYAEIRETVARLSLFWTIITGQGIEIPSLFVICRYSRCRYIR